MIMMMIMIMIMMTVMMIIYDYHNDRSVMLPLLKGEIPVMYLPAHGIGIMGH